MASIALQGYRVKGINNVMVKLYPQVLGIHKVHEHNLCNALRDFGLMLKSDWSELLKYNYDFLKFAHTMRSSELCMIAHGYSLLELDDKKWWDEFTTVASRNSYDMDGKEMAGLLYSLSRVYTGQHPLITKLMDESTPWIQHATPSTLSLLVKVIANLKISGSYLDRINKRAIEIMDQLNMVDVIFFVTSNTEARTRDLQLYRALCMRAIDLYDDMELHHLRALAASLSIGGYKSNLFFNVLSLRLADICREKPLKDGDVISLFLAFTSQKFLTQNDLCIDVQVYKRFVKKRCGCVTKDKFEFPIPELGPVLATALQDNIHKITATGMPIVLRAIAILKIPLEKPWYDRVLQETAAHIRANVYDGLKLSNMVVTIAKRHGRHDDFWDAVHDALTASPSSIEPDLVAKMVATLSNTAGDDSKRRVYKALVEISLRHCNQMTAKSIFALTRVYVANTELEALCSPAYVDAVISLLGQMSLSDIYSLIKHYPFRSFPAGDPNMSRLLCHVRAALREAGEGTPCYALLKALVDGATDRP